MIKIELDIFSGRENPFWTLTPKEENELFSRVEADRSMALPPKKVGNLGYRGFGVKVGKDRAQRWTASGLPLNFYISAGHRPDRSHEKFLLNTVNAGTTAGDSVRQVAQSSIDAANQAWYQRWLQPERAENGPPVTPPNQFGPLLNGPTPVASPEILRTHPTTTTTNTGPTLQAHASRRSAVQSGCGSFDLSSDTDFSFWNSDPYVMDKNNCYNFAADWRSDTFAQPGRKAGVQWTTLACGNSPGEIGYAAAYDGYTLDCWLGGEYYGALVIWPIDPADPYSGDFHWYRLCANGHWCHKPGHTAARNYDDSYNWITDPYYADRGPYTIFCSYRYFPDTYTVQ